LAVSIAVATVHVAVGLSGHETLAGFLVLRACGCSLRLDGRQGTLAVEPMGHIAGSAASAQGFITMVVGAFVGSAIGRAFDGTVVPLVVGTLVCGLAALAVVALAERGRLFQPGRDAQGGRV
jgi:MFS transporter, DHA1 family, multidrug resistance protein